MVEKTWPASIAKAKTVDHKSFLLGIFRFFCAVGIKDAGEEVYYTKWRYRVGITEVQDKLWEDKTFIDATKKLGEVEEFNQFVGHVITDLNACMDEGFQKIPEYKVLIEQVDPSVTDLDKIAQEKRNMKANFDLAKYSLKLVVKMTAFVPGCFSSDEWKNKFASILNFFANKLHRKEFNKYKVNFFI